MSRRTTLLAALVLSSAACSRDVPEDLAITGPAAGIPMGAVGASGVSFDAPTARPEVPHAPRSKPGKPKPAPAPEPELQVPPDPFAAPSDDDDDEPAPKPIPKSKGPKTHSPSETTL
ncbi:Hypothetical protein A7982_03212 [Minicystis rosea]|nr:Hypothetical protein A7982_03212 [Minicystis rosea]